jgi:hypothetical protein
MTSDTEHDLPGSGVRIDSRSLAAAMEAARVVGGGETAAALRQVAEAIERAEDVEAAEIFVAFVDELRSPIPSRELLAERWEELAEAMPSIAELAGAPTTIVALFV